MPVKQTGNWASPQESATVLFDMIEGSPLPSALYATPVAPSEGSVPRFVRFGQDYSGNGVAGQKMWSPSLGGTIATMFPDADQINVGATRLQAVLKRQARCKYIVIPPAFDPSELAGLNATLPFHFRYRLSISVRKIGAGADDVCLFGFMGTSQGLNPPAFEGGPLMAIYSPPNTANYTGVVVRANPAVGGAAVVVPFDVAPIDASVFRRLTAEFSSGPVPTWKFFVDGNLVKLFNTSDIAWAGLSPINRELQLMQGTLSPRVNDGTGSTLGLEGPYMTRATIEMVA